jgi:hypothetical protein
MFRHGEFKFEKKLKAKAVQRLLSSDPNIFDQMYKVVQI